MVAVLSLFSGIGGLDLAVRSVIPSARTVAYVEREAFACEVLVKNMEAGNLDVAPIHTDIQSFPSELYRGKVDLVIGGPPCQPVSLAGKGLADKDERWLWGEFFDVVSVVGPRYVFVENPPGLFTRGFGYVLRSLAALGFDAEWTCLSAAEIGAPHLRKRIFILADADRAGLEGIGLSGVFDRERPSRRDDPHRCNLPLWPPGPEGRFPKGLEPAVRRVAHELPYRLDRLRTLGNAVVPIQAAHALRELISR